MGGDVGEEEASGKKQVAGGKGRKKIFWVIGESKF